MNRHTRPHRNVPRWWLHTALLIAAWLVGHPTTARAQLPALVDVSAEYTPPTTVDHGGDPTKFQLSTYQISLSLPIPLSKRQFLIPGITYHVDSVASPQMTGGDGHSTYHAPELSATFVQLLPRRWSLVARGAAGLAGSFDTVDWRMMTYSVMALANWQASDELTLGAGMLLTGGFGSILPLPAFSVRWKPRDDLRIDAFIPAFATVRYTLWDRVEVGARTEITGKTYAIRGDQTPCPPSGGDMMATDACLDHVRYTIGSVGLLAGVRLTSSLWLSAYAGVSLYRRGEQLDRDDNQLPGTSHTLPRTMFVRTSLAWRLPGS